MNKNIDNELNEKANGIFDLIRYFQEKFPNRGETKVIVQNLTTVTKEINAIRIKEATNDDEIK